LTSCSACQSLRDGSVRRVLIGHGCAAELVLLRAEHEQKIEVGDDLTALGLISRIEYALDRFEIDLEEQTRRRTDAIARLKGYQPRLGEPFLLQGELERDDFSWNRIRRF
jgi:hypothetical protein